MNEQVILPNIRKLFIPDPGYLMFDCDLVGADAQVVAWEANDLDLMAAFRAGLDVHSKNAEDMWGRGFTQLAGDADHGPKRKKRQECKKAVHATNYGAVARTVAVSLGWTIHEADLFQRRWFQIHPPIKSWHSQVQSSLNANKTVSNKFGYRRIYFDRPDAVFPEALAWIPQSTVALVSFFGALQLEKVYSWVEMLLQNHDSIVFQAPETHSGNKKEILEALKVPIPYPDPLVIPWGMSCSKVSWGDVEKVSLS